MNSQLSALLKPTGSSESADGRRQIRSPQSAAKTSARGWRARFASALPWLLILGFLGLLAAVLGNRLLPARELAIATVVTIRQSSDAETNQAPASVGENVDATPALGSADAFEAPMLFQASGWVEPAPYSTLATALLDGVVDTVDVLEGDKVEKGQLLATLIDDDARLDLETSKSQLASLKAQAAGHHRHIAIVEAQIASLAKQVAVAKARSNEATDLVQRLGKISSGGVSDRDKAKARFDLATKDAEVEALVVTEAELISQIEQLKEIQADFSARVAEAKTDVDRKQLTLDRTKIKSPITGRVLRLLAAPGQKKMLTMDHAFSATVAILYDPEEMQARVDVPLAEAAQLAVGQPVRLRSELLAGKTFRGRVTRIVGEADLQRNTLQAKVEIESPDDRLRPDMLCRAEFLPLPAPSPPATGSPLTQTKSSGGGRVQIFVPVSALAKDADESNRTTVWKVDASGDHLTPQIITLGRELREDHQHAASGLKPGDRVVLHPPSDLVLGDRFRPISSAPAMSSTPPKS